MNAIEGVVHGAKALRPFAEAPVKAFFADHCPQLAAAIAYWVLFSLFPLAILLVAVAGLLLRDETARTEVIETLLGYVPAGVEGRTELANLLHDVVAGAGALGVVGAIAVVWTASGLMTTVRTAVNLVWNTDERRPFLRGKLLDVLLVFAVGVFVALSLALTLTLRVVAEVSDRAGDVLGPFEWLADGSMSGLDLLVPLLLTFLTATFVLRVVPAASPRVREVWPGALVAAVTFEAGKNAFAFYLANFGNYNVVYGSLGTLVAFLFFIYLSANLFLFGAEVASEWQCLRKGEAKTCRDSRGRAPRTVGKAPLSRSQALKDAD